MKRVCLAVLVAAAFALGMLGWNYLTVWRPVSTHFAEDVRNAKVHAWTYHQYGVDPSVLVFDLRGFEDDTAPLDITRALLQSADALKDQTFERIVLAFQGTPKLQLNGDYFHTFGTEYGKQNPVYTIRTMPENVYRLDGSRAYATWTGGMLGVLGKQMEDVTQFAKDWYIEELPHK